jgi:hypothetical protein
MQLTAKLAQILPPETGQGKNGEWKRQNIIVETEGQYPKKICITLWGDRYDTAQWQAGLELTIDYDLESREFNGRWYTDVKAWKIENASASAAQQQDHYSSQPPMPQPPLPQQAMPQPPLGSSASNPGAPLPLPSEDDLPF